VLRAGNSWQLGLIRGSDATSAKREAQINIIKTSLRPKGYQPETFAGKTSRPIDAHIIQVMKDFVADGMKRLGVPGAGFSLIDQGKIVYAGGLGVRELGRTAPVDADTLFPAASNTNGDQGNVLVSSLMRKFVEQIFDGRPEADQQLEFAAQRLDIERKRERKQLQIPGDPGTLKELAANYRSEELGDLVVHRTGGNVEFALVDGQFVIEATLRDLAANP
jgi:hypothetical protein